MTQFSDQLQVGGAYFAPAKNWNGSSALNGMPTSTGIGDTQVLGMPLTQMFAYQMGTASTALASGVFYSASGTATTGGGTLTATGALVSNGVATFDVPRGIRVTASVNLSTTTFTFVGTDGYGQRITHSFVGPTGDTIGNTGSYTDSLVAFKTVTSASCSAAATGIATTAILIGDNNAFGLPFVLTNKGMGMDLYIDGASATVPATWTAAYTVTGTPTASTTDVRGLVTAATTALANGSKYFTAVFIAPTVNLTSAQNQGGNSIYVFGATPFSG